MRKNGDKGKAQHSSNLSASATIINDFVFLDGKGFSSTLILSSHRATTQGESRMDADLFYFSSAEADDSMQSLRGVFSANNMDYKSVSYGHQWLRQATGYTFTSLRCARLLINQPPTEARHAQAKFRMAADGYGICFCY